MMFFLTCCSDEDDEDAALVLVAPSTLEVQLELVLAITPGALLPPVPIAKGGGDETNEELGAARRTSSEEAL